MERQPIMYIKEKLGDVVGLTALQEHRHSENRFAWVAFQAVAPFSYRETRSGLIARAYENATGIEGSKNPYAKLFMSAEIITTAGILIGIAVNPDQVDRVGALIGLKIAYNLTMNVLSDVFESLDPNKIKIPDRLDFQ